MFTYWRVVDGRDHFDLYQPHHMWSQTGAVRAPVASGVGESELSCPGADQVGEGRDLDEPW